MRQVFIRYNFLRDMNKDTFKLFQEKFICEARELLVSLEQNLLVLESNPQSKEQIEAVFRVMHTLKGVSAMYGFDAIGNFTHSFESIYDMVREGKIVLSREIFDLTFLAIDHISNLLSDEKLENAELKNRHIELVSKVNILSQKLNNEKESFTDDNENINIENENLQTDNSAENQVNTWYIVMHTDEHFEFRGINLLNIFLDLSELGSFEIEKKDKTGEEGQFDDYWRIYLSTNAKLEQIEDVFLFILDDCTITKLAKVNLFDNNNENLKNKKKEISIIEAIENLIDKKNQAKTETSKENTKEVFKQADSRISVTTDKLDTLMFLVSELVTTKSELLLGIKNSDYSLITNAGEKIDKLSKLFRDNALNIRLVPINDLMLRFRRLIRDLSQVLNKNINFIVEGEDTELDKKIIDTIGEPLMHLIRNCIDHGIETPEQRVNSGKSDFGNIYFSAKQEGNAIIIKIADDGKGIDTELIRNKAIEKAIINADQKLSRAELFDLIFLPGFSTAESLTQVSGRGVGMDVVKNKLAELKAEIFIESQPNKGTEFLIKIQQSVAILDTLLFQNGDLYFLIPICDIEVCALIDASIIEATNNTGTIPFNNQLVPYIDVFRLFSTGKSTQKKLRLIIINHQNNRFAIAAEKILGEHQAVLKTVGKDFNAHDKIAGLSILGDGNLAYLLDSNKLHS